MFNGDLKTKAISQLTDSQEQLQETAKKAQQLTEDLYKQRLHCSKSVLDDCESYFNKLTNKPKEFDRTFSEFKSEIVVFTELVQKYEKEFQIAQFKAGTTAGAGVMAGAGVAAFAPTAAMAIATTFGAASTGTAIATLSGAAATNAALAWLGGGALVAGGGGMAAGNGLLALAGPIGWGIGAVALVGGGLMARKKNKEIAEKANRENQRVLTKISDLNVINVGLDMTVSLTKDHAENITNVISHLTKTAPSNYMNFTNEQKDELIALHNNIKSLTQLINLKLD